MYFAKAEHPSCQKIKGRKLRPNTKTNDSRQSETIAERPVSTNARNRRTAKNNDDSICEGRGKVEYTIGETQKSDNVNAENERPSRRSREFAKTILIRIENDQAGNIKQ